MTAAGLAAVLADPETGAELRRFAGFAESAAYVTPDEAEAGAPADTASAVRAYVLNTHTMKFHLPDCPSVGEILTANRQDITAARQEVIELGYAPCGRCHP